MKRLFAMITFLVLFSVPCFRLSDEEYLSMKENNPYYARAESELTKVWDELKSSHSVQAFDELKQEQLAWINTERDKEAEVFLERGYSRAEAYTFVTEKRVEYLRGKLDSSSSESKKEVASSSYAVSNDTNISSSDTTSENSNLNEAKVVESKDMGSDPNFDLADKLVGEGKIPMYVRDKGKFICDPNFKYVHVTGSTVNLRSQPNAKANILGKAHAKDQTGFLPYLGEWTHPDGKRWILAERSRKSVWISGEYAELLDEAGYQDALWAQARQIKRGDVLTFGVYEQDNNHSNGKEPIEWIVLDKRGSELLLISRYCLDCRIYNSLDFWEVFYVKITWEDCEMRKWLNTTFLSEAFNSNEQEMISQKRLSNLDNPKYNTDGGNNTEDRVFLLSINEAIRYFPSNETRKTSPTLYAYNRGASVRNGYCKWYLRSPGYFKFGAATVEENGEMSYSGAEPNVGFIAVRPAMWIDVSK